MTPDTVQFAKFQKIPRLSREMIVTEKIDGTSAQVFVAELPGKYTEEELSTIPLVATHGNRLLYAGSRTRYVTPDADNFGFSGWVKENAACLAQLGPGRHFGEWWGRGIQRGYGLQERRFSLFNVHSWGETRPACCHVVPVLYRGPFDTGEVDAVLAELARGGSLAAPGYMNPEGVVVFHVAGGHLYKKTIGDDGHKGNAVDEAGA